MTLSPDSSGLTVHRADERGETRLSWLHSRHAFSFGAYHNPQLMGFRTLRVLNDDVVAPAGGFGEHGHDNMEILTWVLQGALEHGDSLGHLQKLGPGELQVMTAGSGIRHRELNASRTDAVHFLQIWIEPAIRNAAPNYVQVRFDAAGRAGQWQVLASGRGAEGAVPIAQDADVAVAELSSGESLSHVVAPGRAAYLHVALGEVSVNGVDLAAGDAARTEQAGELAITARGDAQVLLFDLP